jgi:copper chaperone CopZ
MKIENISARLYTLSDGTKLIPNETTKGVSDSLLKEVEGIKELKVTQETKAQEVEFKEVPNTVKELKAALDGLNVEYASNADKAELQALYDENKAK